MLSTNDLANKKVLRGIDLEVQRGETCVVLGRSGGGKSVLLKHIIGLLKPTAGAVLVDGEDIAAMPEQALGPLRRRVGVLFQSGALFDSMNVAENIAFPLREAGMQDAATLRERVSEALAMVDLCRRGKEDAGEPQRRHAQAGRPGAHHRLAARMPALR